MSISVDEVKKIAHLARLRLDEQEAQGYADSLSQILGLIEQMKKDIASAGCNRFITLIQIVYCRFPFLVHHRG